MANASKRHVGVGSQGKHSGSGALTDLVPEAIGENAILSNRDKSLHSGERGYDGKASQADQMVDNALNQHPTGPER